MRRAREGRGISLRSLSSRLGYNSHSTLSAYELGATMPTDEIVEKYEAALRLPKGERGDQLEKARVQRQGNEFAKRRAPGPGGFELTEPLPQSKPEAPVAPLI